MGTPAAVLGDRIQGTCVGHQIPMGPGNPGPAPPLPFSAPVIEGVATTVLVNNKPMIGAGAAGLNMPPHVGLHASDPFMAPPMQRGTVLQGSATVVVEGKPAARLGSQCMLCLGLTTGQLMGTAATVLIGG